MKGWPVAKVWKLRVLEQRGAELPGQDRVLDPQKQPLLLRREVLRPIRPCCKITGMVELCSRSRPIQEVTPMPRRGFVPKREVLPDPVYGTTPYHRMTFNLLGEEPQQLEIKFE